MTAAMVLEDGSWHEDAITALVELSIKNNLITADDLRREMRPAPHGNHVGAAFTAAKKLGYIEPVSYTTSTSATRRHGALRTWRAKSVKPTQGDLREGFMEWECKPEHFGHADGEWFYACEACSGLPNDRNEIAP